PTVYPYTTPIRSRRLGEPVVEAANHAFLPAPNTSYATTGQQMPALRIETEDTAPTAHIALERPAQIHAENLLGSRLDPARNLMRSQAPIAEMNQAQQNHDHGYDNPATERIAKHTARHIHGHVMGPDKCRATGDD